MLEMQSRCAHLEPESRLQDPRVPGVPGEDEALLSVPGVVQHLPCVETHSMCQLTKGSEKSCVKGTRVARLGPAFVTLTV